ncbi:MAG: hypothetical protein ACI9IO_000996 [Cyanobium sp.]|jgi:hypothetical protein
MPKPIVINAAGKLLTVRSSNHHGEGGREHNEMPWLRIEGDYLSPLA